MSPLGTVEMTALSGIVQAGIARLLDGGYTIGGEHLHRLQGLGRQLMEDPRFADYIASMEYGQGCVVGVFGYRSPDDVTNELAALAMGRGGINILGVLFCAAHCPAGVESDARRCGDCTPGILRRIFR